MVWFAHTLLLEKYRGWYRHWVTKVLVSVVSISAELIQPIIHYTKATAQETFEDRSIADIIWDSYRGVISTSVSVRDWAHNEFLVWLERSHDFWSRSQRLLVLLAIFRLLYYLALESNEPFFNSDRFTLQLTLFLYRYLPRDTSAIISYLRRS